ncbi:hypothetical protein [Sphaerochaeta halotolerans]|jgi:hypothetical protein|uniref:YbbR-like domain-containing protein n=1 Tax=Sphaerochaeta halotolerans TaxID=2293840 RepID=A0A372MIX6_9SPIR|nr:hypothetical protein [Sphaerochaeta halotolerans]MBG0766511.1 hypothetical protein [Spirochaetaceae bacterium]MDK2859273.1 hypothetical protein [Sphaerochaeta sp.]MDN5332806.1 hypothetical protein [Sphaerochaeta sp.]MXI85172.1 hypothetical protein [Sphaerochaeta halotolerans]RFU95757.1 hypothetical protein DYP60_01760 [Sphaerochaeta halotolerans]
MKLNNYLQSVTYNWPAKVLSLVLAILVYAFIQFSTMGDRVVSIPIEVHLPTSLEAESLVPSSIEVSIQGNEDIIYLINPESIKASLDFSSVEKAGIATAPVVLRYEEDVFESAGIALQANPQYYRILFKEGSAR